MSGGADDIITISLANQLTGVTVTLTNQEPDTSSTPTVIDSSNVDDNVGLELTQFLRGAQGAQGIPGTSNVPLLFEVVASANGAQSYALGSTPTFPVSVYVNGLRQRSNAFTLASNIVTLPSTLNIEIGDLIQIEF